MTTPETDPYPVFCYGCDEPIQKADGKEYMAHGQLFYLCESCVEEAMAHEDEEERYLESEDGYALPE
jgi:hypothetical protein